jgi:LysM repeat protein
MTIALVRPALALPRVALPSLLSAPRRAAHVPEPRRYASAPRSAARGVGVPAPQRATAQETVPHLRITRRGRAVLTLLAAVPLSAGAVMLVSVAGAPSSSASVSTSAAAAEASESSLSGGSVVTETAETSVSDYVQVASGDSLWSVAEAIAPDADPREVIDDLVRTNALDSLDVYPGQQLEVPTQY